MLSEILPEVIAILAAVVVICYAYYKYTQKTKTTEDDERGLIAKKIGDFITGILNIFKMFKPSSTIDVNTDGESTGDGTKQDDGGNDITNEK